jgi:flagellar biosynthesis protein FlhF
MMRIKTFTSDSVPQALLKIREEMGPGAVILKSNRTVKKRFFGLLPKMAYEITAAADPVAEGSQSAEETGTAGDRGVGALSNSPFAGATAEMESVEGKAVETYEAAIENPGDENSARTSRATEPKEGCPKQPGPRFPQVIDERRWMDQFARLSDEIQSLVRMVSQQQKDDTISSLFLNNQQVARQLQDLIWGDETVDLEARKTAFGEFHYLLREGVDENYAFLILKEALRGFPVDEDSRDRLRLRLNRCISRMTSTAPIDWTSGPRAHMFVGPTGVGKTTTIAKLAARFALKDRCRVSLLTFDTYRIAAAEQLRTYGEIIGIPVKVVFSLEELDVAISAAGPDEVLLIDTTGHSHKKISEYGELSDYVRTNPRIQKHLVVSCTTGREALREIVSSFGVFGPDRLVFTKLDECSSFGVILNELARTRYPLSYLTNGQDVAEDLIVPSPSTLADLLVPLS